MNLIHTLAISPDERSLAVTLTAITGGLFVIFVSIICKTIRKSVEVRHREESRRELAAYVAEGTMSPDDAYKILSAGANTKGGCC